MRNARFMSAVLRRSRLLLVAGAVACTSDAPTGAPLPSLPAVLLRDVVVAHLPDPFYHFDYDATGRMAAVSFASGLRRYVISYEAGRISEVRDVAAANGDRLAYFYDDAGRVREVTHVNGQGVLNGRVLLAYDGNRLFALRRERRIDGTLLIDRAMLFSYHADGNVREIVEHHPPVLPGVPAIDFVDLYEQYDEKINVDAFSLLHREFGDHLLLLPGVQLQKGNPGRLTRTGDGINFTIDFTYTYDGNRPLIKRGAGIIVDGSQTGPPFETESRFSYY